MAPKERASILGKRFEAFVSSDRSIVDIVDRENTGHLILLSGDDLSELRDLLEELGFFMDRAR